MIQMMARMTNRLSLKLYFCNADLPFLLCYASTDLTRAPLLGYWAGNSFTHYETNTRHISRFYLCLMIENNQLN